MHDDVRRRTREQNLARQLRVKSSPLWRRGLIVTPCGIPFGIVGALLGGVWATIGLCIGFAIIAIGGSMLMLAIRRTP
jgi:hypothetical protein